MDVMEELGAKNLHNKSYAQLLSLREKCCTIPDSELRRVGWAKLFDPLATNPQERTFWCNRSVNWWRE
jgi:hypothetical protein